MMELIGRYIVSLSAAAILCGILKTILPSKGPAAGILHLVSGIFLTFVAIQPLARIELDELPEITGLYLSQAAAASDQGKDLAHETMADIIKSRTEAYILDKAQGSQQELRVVVTLSSADPPVPVAATLSGSISPYAKSCLERILQEELGISKENQLWIGS